MTNEQKLRVLADLARDPPDFVPVCLAPVCVAMSKVLFRKDDLADIYLSDKSQSERATIVDAWREES